MKKIGHTNTGKILLIALFIILCLVPLFIKSTFYLHIIIMMMFYACFGAAWNFIGGFGGQFSLGHAGFFGIGAYTSTLLYVKLGLTPLIGMWIAMAFTVLVAVIIFWPVFRLRGHYFCLATIAFAEVIRLLVNYFKGLTNGAGGVLIPFDFGFQYLTFFSKIPYYYWILILMVIVLSVSWWFQRSRIGYYLIALRENEEAASACGVITSKYKLIAMMFSAAFSSLVGTFYAHYIQIIDPEGIFNLNHSIQAALVPIIGGIGTAFGPLLGAFILTPIGEGLRSVLGSSGQGIHLIIYGLALILVINLMPEGVLAKFNNLLSKRRNDNEKASVIEESSSSEERG